MSYVCVQDLGDNTRCLSSRDLSLVPAIGLCVSAAALKQIALNQASHTIRPFITDMSLIPGASWMLLLMHLDAFADGHISSPPWCSGPVDIGVWHASTVGCCCGRHGTGGRPLLVMQALCLCLEVAGALNKGRYQVITVICSSKQTKMTV